MDINNISTNNFKGTFVFKPKTQQIRDAIPNIIPKGKQIFHDIKSEGDVVMVTKDKYDKRVLDFIKAEGISFEFFPEISTKNRLDDEIPSVLKKLISVQTNSIVRDVSMVERILNVIRPLRQQKQYVLDATHTIRLNIENPEVKVDNSGLFTIRDDAKKRTIKSTSFRHGYAYMCVIPDSINQEIQKFLIGNNGKVVVKKFETPKDLKDFNKAFAKAIGK